MRSKVTGKVNLIDSIICSDYLLLYLFINTSNVLHALAH